MAQDSCYGDELCINALARAMQLHINVYSPDYPIQKFGSPLHPSISLAYTGSNHFDAIITLDHSSNHVIQATPLWATQVEPDSSKSFVIISSNITSLRKNWIILKQQPADIVAKKPP